MKRTLALVPIFAALATMSCTPTVAAADTSTLLSFRDGQASQVVSTPLKKFTYRKIDFTVSPFAGFTFDQAKPTGGVMVGPQFKGWQAGIYGRWVQGKPVDAGIYLGFSWQK